MLGIPAGTPKSCSGTIVFAGTGAAAHRSLNSPWTPIVGILCRHHPRHRSFRPNIRQGPSGRSISPRAATVPASYAAPVGRPRGLRLNRMGRYPAPQGVEWVGTLPRPFATSLDALCQARTGSPDGRCTSVASTHAGENGSKIRPSFFLQGTFRCRTPCRGGPNRSDKGLNLSGSWQQGHSAAYNAPSHI